MKEEGLDIIERFCHKCKIGKFKEDTLYNPRKKVYICDNNDCRAKFVFNRAFVCVKCEHGKLSFNGKGSVVEDRMKEATSYLYVCDLCGFFIWADERYKERK